MPMPHIRMRAHNLHYTYLFAVHYMHDDLTPGTCLYHKLVLIAFSCGRDTVCARALSLQACALDHWLWARATPFAACAAPLQNSFAQIKRVLKGACSRRPRRDGPLPLPQCQFVSGAHIHVV